MRDQSSNNNSFTVVDILMSKGWINLSSDFSEFLIFMKSASGYWPKAFSGGLGAPPSAAL